MNTKTCKRCGSAKPPDQFPVHRAARDGRHSWCGSCHSAYGREKYLAHRDAILERSRQQRADRTDEQRAQDARKRRERYEKNRDHERARNKRWYEENRDRVRAINRAWQDANRERYRELVQAGSSRRRARLAGARVEYVPRSVIIERDRSRCHFCGKKVAAGDVHIDHLIPVSWAERAPEFEHTARNLAVACRSCNLKSKDGRLPAQLRLIA